MNSAALRAPIALFLSLASYGATVRFEPANPLVGPFPSDALTVADASQKTGLRVNLPLPDCNVQPSSCAELSAVNQLDGFNLQPRVRVTFSAPVDINTLRAGIVVFALDNLTGDEFGLQRMFDVVGMNEVVWDPATNTAYAKPDDLLDQHRRYAVLVTDAVRDATGLPLTPASDFAACIAFQPNQYCAALAAAVATAGPMVAPSQVVAASVFTTMSATAWMEKAHAAVATGPAPYRMLTPAGGYAVSNLATIIWHRQVGMNPTQFNDITVPLDPTLLAGIGRVAVGSFQSPNFLNARQTIDAAPTGADVALPSAVNEIVFSVYLPSAPRPAAGYPVAIFGHGLGDSRLGGPTAVAASLAQSGIATIAITAVGHGYGPESTIVLVDKSGNPAIVPGGGRGLDLNGDGKIEGVEGCLLPGAGAILRDCLRQTALDLSQLVRVIRNGIDVEGTGSRTLDPSRIYYGGQSLGSFYGSIFSAIEPAVGATMLNAGGGSVVDVARWSPAYRPVIGAMLLGRQPPAVNTPAGPVEDYVLRYKAVKVATVPGSVDIQNLLEIYEWLGMPGDPLAFVPHLRVTPLPGLPYKPVLFQYAFGDQTVPNPSETRLVRAARAQDSTWIYRHDYARAAVPSLPADPHAYLVLFLSSDLDVSSIDLRSASISLSAQKQMAAFFEAGGRVIPDPNSLVLRLLFGRDLFESPMYPPEELNF